VYGCFVLINSSIHSHLVLQNISGIGPWIEEPHICEGKTCSEIQIYIMSVQLHLCHCLIFSNKFYDKANTNILTCCCYYGARNFFEMKWIFSLIKHIKLCYLKNKPGNNKSHGKTKLKSVCHTFSNTKDFNLIFILQFKYYFLKQLCIVIVWQMSQS